MPPPSGRLLNLVEGDSTSATSPCGLAGCDGQREQGIKMSAYCSLPIFLFVSQTASAGTVMRLAFGRYWAGAGTLTCAMRIKPQSNNDLLGGCFVSLQCKMAGGWNQGRHGHGHGCRNALRFRALLPYLALQHDKYVRRTRDVGSLSTKPLPLATTLITVTVQHVQQHGALRTEYEIRGPMWSRRHGCQARVNWLISTTIPTVRMFPLVK